MKRTEARLGLRLNLVREGRGEPLVLLHPVGLDLTFWEATASDLKADFEVIRLDLPGHGETPPLPPGATLSDYSAAVHETLTGAGVTRAHIAGLSFGGMIAQTLAIEHPELCASLIAAGCSATVPDAERPARAQRGLIAVREGMAAVVETTLERWFTPAFLASGAAEATRARLLSQNVEGWRAAWEAISRLHTAPDLPKVTVRALCIAGAGDLAAPPSAVRGLADLIPGAEYAVIEGAPHMMQIETPAAFSGLVRRFLAVA